jgi:D-glycero-alpha-D-manno-heptose-7-phosphate kinase
MFYMGNEVTVKDPNAMYDWDSQVDSLNHSAKLSEEASAILKGQRDLSDIGYMLHESWELKKRLCNEVSTPKIDGVYSRAIDAGALGGKLTGAGGGGMLLLFVPTVKQDPVREALADMIEVPFKCDHLGSRVVYTDERTSSN